MADVEVRVLSVKVKPGGYEPRARKPRVYPFVANWSVQQDLIEGGRYNKPSAAIRAAKAELFGTEVPLMGFVNDRIRTAMTATRSSMRTGITQDTKWVWSQKAGCSCPCSPGFIVQGEMTHYPADVYITYEVVAVDAAKEAVA